jgi:hypothetical protein
MGQFVTIFDNRRKVITQKTVNCRILTWHTHGCGRFVYFQMQWNSIVPSEGEFYGAEPSIDLRAFLGQQLLFFNVKSARVAYNFAELSLGEKPDHQLMHPSRKIRGSGVTMTYRFLVSALGLRQTSRNSS